MITDDLQDQAALFVLGALNPEENATFEKMLAADPELRAMVRELREAAADLGGSVPAHEPPADLKRRVLREIALEKQTGIARGSTTPSFSSWMPWAAAALFLISCGILAVDRMRLQRELAEARATDPLSQATLVTLGSPNGEHPDAKVTIAWQPDRQSGVININKMPPAGPGRDYQLWAVDANHKDPINAGIVHVDSNGVAHIRFKPDQEVTQIRAFAISLEREGGVPKREGPIVMIGNA
ncbi:MAG TPA: anti-sigma factor [Chthoniobacterales bacterium]|nr:anti-sigma factor [Chthoniobacterales bacterium]